MKIQPHILVADDDASVRNVLQLILESQGWYVVTVANGQEAIEILEREVFDVAILDLRMPSLDGMQVLEISVVRFPHTDMIMLTGYSTLDNAVEAMKKGAKDYLTKPILPEKLLQVIQELLKIKKIPPCLFALRMDQFVKDKIANPGLKLSHVLEQFRISESYACRMFKTAFGMTFRQRMAKHRIDYASYMLETTSDQMCMIAETCGFHSQQAFRDAFFKLKHMPPSQYRKICSGRK